MSDSQNNGSKSQNHSAIAAANLVRTKLKTLYAREPNVVEEEKEIVSSGVHSKHQEFIRQLMGSGKSLADTQSAWHAYYKNLPDNEKHQVWQEFYEQHTRAQQTSGTASNKENSLIRNSKISSDSKPQSMADLHKKLVDKVNANGKLKPKHHFKSAVFALFFASVATGLMFFITNNERFIAPFIQPSVNASAAPIITDGSSVGPESKIIIPKLNLEAPIVIDIASNSEEDIQHALESGVALYPFTGLPGEKGNPIIFGHSSNNLFNRGEYKFVFVRLHQLDIGDTYAINYNGTQYVYKIFSREVVSPDRVDLLYYQPKDSMSTLITCDPPGTSNNRLVLHAEQISPDPAANIASSTLSETSDRPEAIPSNAPSLIRRLFGF